MFQYIKGRLILEAFLHVGSNSQKRRSSLKLDRAQGIFCGQNEKPSEIKPNLRKIKIFCDINMISC